MDLTIEQALQQGVAAQTEGKVQEAERLYRTILEVQPTHPHANHNLGALATYRFKSQAALPFFEIALEKSPEIEQFWLSYIEAFIRIDEIESARRTIKTAKKCGFSSELFDALEVQSLTPIEHRAKGSFFQAQDGTYRDFLKVLHEKKYEMYFEIGSCDGSSLSLSQSPSVAIDPNYQLTLDPVGNKDFCLLFQEKSDYFFEETLPKFPHLKCQLGFIDGMHLFEYALRDFINLAKNSSEKPLFLFHDVLPWNYEMATRDYKKIPRGKGEPWTGDIWKLIPIFINLGMEKNMKILTAAPSGLLAISNPSNDLITKLEDDFDRIVAEWTDIELDRKSLSALYESKIFVKPEIYLRFLESQSFGEELGDASKDWVSH